MNELPIPADHRLWIEEFQAYEGTNLSAVEICRQTQIPLYEVRQLQRMYAAYNRLDTVTSEMTVTSRVLILRKRKTLYLII